MKYLFVDTNIFIACALLIKPNHSPKTIKKLREFLDSGEVKLILPEIVEIEFFRVVDTELSKIETVVNNFKKIIKDNLPSYFGTEKEEHIKSAESIFKKRKESSEIAKEIINSLFNSKNTIKIPITYDIFIKAYKRALSGKKPYELKWCTECDELKDIINADCLIIESIISEINKLGKIEFIFCSDNNTDFAIFNEKEKKHIFHPEIKPDLPKNSKYYLHLTEALDAEFKAEIKQAEKDKLRKSLDYLKEAAATVPPLPDYLKEAMLSAKPALDHIKEAMASLAMSPNYVKEAMASLALSPEILKKQVASFASISETLKEQLASAASVSEALKNQLSSASKIDVSKFKKKENKKNTPSKKGKK